MNSTTHTGCNNLKYEEIDFEEGWCKTYKEYRQAAHGMLYSFEPNVTFGVNRNAIVLMQLRYDGTIGFPGGMIDKNADAKVVDGLNRECIEEIGLEQSCYFQEDDYLVSHIYHEGKIVLHFFIRQIPLEAFQQTERNSLYCIEWGNETLGIIRAPLYDFKNGLGLEAFMKHNFVGNAREQMILGLKNKKLIDDDLLKKL